MRTFEIPEDHLKLVQNMYFEEGYCEACSPAVDQKRPFGNSDWEWDVVRILHPDQYEDLLERWNEGQAEDEVDALYWEASSLMQELPTVLEICARTLSFVPGKYTSDDYKSNWTRAE